MRLGDVAGLGQQQSDRVLGRREYVGLRGVDYYHAPPGGGGDVDIVQADARPPHDGEVTPCGQDFFGHLGGGAYDQGRGAGDHLEQFSGGQPEADVHFVTGLGEQFKAGRGDLFGDQDAGHPPCSHPGGARLQCSRGAVRWAGVPNQVSAPRPAVLADLLHART